MFKIKNIIPIITIIILILIFSFTILRYKIQSHENQLVIVFYNVENLFDTIDDPYNYGDNEFTATAKKKWNLERYEKKSSDLAKVIASINNNELPDIIGLCEVENRKVVEDLIEQNSLSAEDYGIVHEESPDYRGIDVALIYKKSEFNYLTHNAIKVNLPEDKKYQTRDILYVKGLISEKDTLHIFVNHWKSRYGGINETEYKRINAAKILRAKIDSIIDIDNNANIICLGDFNDEPQNKSLNTTLIATNNKTPANKYELFNTLYEKDLNNEGTYSYNYKWFMLDNIIISQNLISNETGFHISDESGQIYKEDWILHYNSKANMYVPNKTYGGKTYYGGYSDHLPVYLILENNK